MAKFGLTEERYKQIMATCDNNEEIVEEMKILFPENED